MDIEESSNNSSNNPDGVTSTVSSSNAQQTAQIPGDSLQITLSQSDFLNADFLVQSLFLYLLKKTDGESNTESKHGCYLICKYFSPAYSIGTNGSLIVRIKYADPQHGDCHRITCKRIKNKDEKKKLIAKSDVVELNLNQDDKRISEGDITQKELSQLQDNKPSSSQRQQEKQQKQFGAIPNENTVLFDWISKILEFYSGTLPEQDILELQSTFDATKNYIQELDSQISQIKKYHESYERQLNQISENRLDLMRQAAQRYVQSHFEDTDFIVIFHFQTDFSTERMKFVEVEMNPAALSLLGTHSSQFTSLIMRNGMQMCHKETHIVDLFFQWLKKMVFQREADQNEFIVKDQRFVLVDKIVTACDIHGIVLQNSWEEYAPFIPQGYKGKDTEIEQENHYGCSLDSVLIQQVLLSPEQIKEILELRSAQDTLKTVRDKENQLAYTLESENFCERFYPGMKFEEDGKQQALNAEEENKKKRLCKIKDIS